MKRKMYIGIFAGIITACLLGGGGILVKVLMNMGVHPMMIIVLSHIAATPMLALLIHRQKVSFGVTRQEGKELLIVSLIGMGPTNITIFLAFNYMPVGQAVTIHYLYPVVILFLELLIFGVRIYKAKWIAIVLSLIGMFFLAQSSDSVVAKDGYMLGVLFAFASAIFNAIYFSRVDHSILKQMNVVKISFFMCILTITQPLIFIIYKGVTWVNLSTGIWMIIIVFGFLASVVATICLQISIKYCGAVTAGVTSMLQPIIALVAGVLFLNETLNRLSIIACAFIISAVLIIFSSSENQEAT